MGGSSGQKLVQDRDNRQGHGDHRGVSYADTSFRLQRELDSIHKKKQPDRMGS